MTKKGQIEPPALPRANGRSRIRKRSFAVDGLDDGEFEAGTNPKYGNLLVKEILRSVTGITHPAFQ